MSELNFGFQVPRIVEQQPVMEKVPLEISIVEQEKFGLALADRITNAINEAKAAGKKLVFDMATGSSPKDAWPALQQKIAQGDVDLSNVIVIGHEEAWGSYAPGDHSDFDAYRRRELFERNEIPVEEIREADQIDSGNFVPMHLAETASDAAAKHAELVRALREHPDVTVFGLYGVGTDGHIGEIQTNSMGVEPTLARRETYAEQIKDYSVESGLFQWQDQNPDTAQEFQPENNIFWKRGDGDEATGGRAAWQGYGGMTEIIGLGLREMLQEEEIVLAFNKADKKLAFTLALDGALTGDITDAEGTTVSSVERDKGEGEAILPDLVAFAQRMRQDGFPLDTEQLLANKPGCKELFNALYTALNKMDASMETHAAIYEELWRFANRYVGKRAPVSRLVRLRSLFGRKTELVATPEVVAGTKYEHLAGQ